MNSLLAASIDPALTVLVPLQDKVPDDADVNTGWWYVVVFFALIGAVILLWRSMRKQLGRIRFEEQPAPPRRPGRTSGTTDEPEDPTS